MSEVKEKKRRRKKDASRAEYMRAYRSKKSVGATKEISKSGMGDVAAREGQEPLSAPAPLPEEIAAAEKARSIAEAEQVLAGIIEAATESIQVIALEPDAPHFGHDRSQQVAKLWAPILAPYITGHMDEWARIAAAGGLTAAACYAWRHEYKEYRKAHPSKHVTPGAQKPSAAPAQADRKEVEHEAA